MRSSMSVLGSRMLQSHGSSTGPKLLCLAGSRAGSRMFCPAVFCFGIEDAGPGTGPGMLCPDGSKVGSGTLCPSSCTGHDEILGSGGSLCCQGVGAHGRGLEMEELGCSPCTSGRGIQRGLSQRHHKTHPQFPQFPPPAITNSGPRSGPSPSEFSPNPFFPNPSHPSKISGRRHPLQPLLINPLSGIH